MISEGAETHVEVNGYSHMAEVVRYDAHEPFQDRPLLTVQLADAMPTPADKDDLPRFMAQIRHTIETCMKCDDDRFLHDSPTLSKLYTMAGGDPKALGKGGAE